MSTYIYIHVYICMYIYIIWWKESVCVCRNVYRNPSIITIILEIKEIWPWWLHKSVAWLHTQNLAMRRGNEGPCNEGSCGRCFVGNGAMDGNGMIVSGYWESFPFFHTKHQSIVRKECFPKHVSLLVHNVHNIIILYGSKNGPCPMIWSYISYWWDIIMMIPFPLGSIGHHPIIIPSNPHSLRSALQPGDPHDLHGPTPPCSLVGRSEEPIQSSEVPSHTLVVREA